MSRAKLYRLRTGAEREEFGDFSKRVMQRGNDEEPVIRRLLSAILGDDYVAVGEWNLFYGDGELARLCATPDAIVFSRTRPQQQFLAEFKRCEKLVDEPRLPHMLQVVTQCVVTGASCALLFYVSPAGGFRLYLFRMCGEIVQWFVEEIYPQCIEMINRITLETGEPGREKNASANRAACAEMLARHFVEVLHFKGRVYEQLDIGDGQFAYELPVRT